MAELKTKKTEVSVTDFIKTIPDAQKQKDCLAIAKMMEEATGAKAKMWGPAIIGFGDVQLKYESGRELDWFKIGFSPRKANIAFYMSFDINRHQKTLDKLGKYKTGKGCLYINKLEDVDTKVLRGMMDECMKVNKELPVIKKNKND